MVSVKKKKKGLRKFIWILSFLFFMMNFVAWFHAYKFTHFDAQASYKTPDGSRLGAMAEIKTILFGITNIRPQNHAFPDSPYQTVLLRSNRKIACWLIRSAGHRGAVALFHGYAGNKSSLLEKAPVFLNLGYDVLLVDFMGSGDSEGVQTTIGYLEAEQVKSAFDYLAGIGEKNIILFGSSMGAVAIMKAVADHQLNPAGIILECPFGTLLQTVQVRFHRMHIPEFPMSYLLVFWGGVQNGFNAFSHRPVDYAKSIHCPALLLYGEKDDKVSRSETDAIFKNLQGPKRLETYPLAGHANYLIQYKVKWTSDVTAFLKDLPDQH